MKNRFKISLFFFLSINLILLGCGSSSSDSPKPVSNTVQKPASDLSSSQQPIINQSLSSPSTDCTNGGGHWTGSECKVCSLNQYYDATRLQCVNQQTAATTTTSTSSTSTSGLTSSSSGILGQLQGLLTGLGGGTGGSLTDIQSLLNSLPAGDLSNLIKTCPIIQGILSGTASESDLSGLLGGGGISGLDSGCLGGG